MHGNILLYCSAHSVSITNYRGENLGRLRNNVTYMRVISLEIQLEDGFSNRTSFKFFVRQRVSIHSSILPLNLRPIINFYNKAAAHFRGKFSSN
jgi:hypothetical protein